MLHFGFGLSYYFYDPTFQVEPGVLDDGVPAPGRGGGPHLPSGREEIQDRPAEAGARLGEKRRGLGGGADGQR